MGLGACVHNRPPALVPKLTELNTPSKSNSVAFTDESSSKKLDRKARRRSTPFSGKSVRHDCTSFYWDITSVVVKSPRRLIAYASRKPEPKPFFTCANWGYRVCACGHHYYDHRDAAPKPPLSPIPGQSALKPGQALDVQATPKKDIAEDTPMKPQAKDKRRRWYWPFG